jgi:hypothetical protein
MTLAPGERVLAFVSGTVESINGTPIIKIEGTDQVIINHYLEYIRIYDCKSFTEFLDCQLTDNQNPSSKDIINWLNAWQAITSRWETLQEIADVWGVSKSTVSVFAKRGGYKNFILYPQIRVEPEEALSIKPVIKRKAHRLIGRRSSEDL